MRNTHNLNRFLEAQENTYQQALTEIRNGRKTSHWIWYVFPQVAGLGFSETSKFYAIESINEATAYLNHPILGKRLLEITKALLQHQNRTANQILGSPDDLKLKSSMTLFKTASTGSSVFEKVLDQFFRGEEDQKTQALLQ